MPQVPTPTLFDLPSAEAKKLRKLLFERDVLGYAFSYAALLKLVTSLQPNADESEAVEAIFGCVAACKDDEEKTVKDGLKEKIGEIFLTHDIKAVRHEDPFGRKMDCILYETKTPSRLDQKKMVEMAPQFKIPTGKLMELMEAATKPGEPYVAMKVVEVKEKE